MTDPIIETAAQVIYNNGYAAALEKAAKVAEDARDQEYEVYIQLKAAGNTEKAVIYSHYVIEANVIAATIRALIPKDSGDGSQ